MNANNVQAAATATPSPPAPSHRHPLRRRIAGAIAVTIAAVAIAGWWTFAGRYRETTEDAYVNGNIVAVTSQIGGVVTAIAADDTDYVRTGKTLIKLDRVDTELALSKAEAGLARTVRQVRARFAAVAQMRAMVDLNRVELAKARADLARRQHLAASGAVSGEAIKHAQDAVHAATAALNAAQQRLAASQALVSGTRIATNPEVLGAAAQVRDAWVAAKRTAIPAPVSGLVTKRNVQLGEKIAPGVALMSVVPLDDLWVDANFKESQLRHIRIGQPVKLTADVYGSAVIYHGRVVGQDAGTGSAFSLLPAQNATGNWIKVVQRIPIRIALDPREVAAHPLQLGLSMKVAIDTHHRDGRRLATGPTREHGYATGVFASELDRADDDVDRIIQANR